METNLRYAEGHRKVLEAYGIKQVTSTKHDWLEDPNTYVVIVESEDRKRILGGTRIQLKTEHLPLPMEVAIAKIDSGIYKYMEQFGDYNVAEFCGLFNSLEVAGYGIGSIYLGRSAIAIASQLGISSLVGLCSPVTLSISKRTGFEVLTDLGDNGAFFYPKEGLIATSIIIRDLENLPHANPREREKIFELRKNPSLNITELGRKGPMEISYNLTKWKE